MLANMECRLGADLITKQSTSEPTCFLAPELRVLAAEPIATLCCPAHQSSVASGLGSVGLVGEEGGLVRA